MRKYTKPVMEMEKIEMNQAIAKCEDGKKGVELIPKGYSCVWCGCADADQVFDDYDVAHEYHKAKHNADPKISFFYDAILNGQHVAYYEDYTEDGVFKLTDGDNWQNVENGIVNDSNFQS